MQRFRFQHRLVAVAALDGITQIAGAVSGIAVPPPWLGLRFDELGGHLRVRVFRAGRMVSFPSVMIPVTGSAATRAPTREDEVARPIGSKR